MLVVAKTAKIESWCGEVGYKFSFTESLPIIGVAKAHFATPQMKLVWRPPHLATPNVRP